LISFFDSLNREPKFVVFVPRGRKHCFPETRVANALRGILAERVNQAQGVSNFLKIIVRAEIGHVPQYFAKDAIRISSQFTQGIDAIMPNQPAFALMTKDCDVASTAAPVYVFFGLRESVCGQNRCLIDRDVLIVHPGTKEIRHIVASASRTSVRNFIDNWPIGLEQATLPLHLDSVH